MRVPVAPRDHWMTFGIVCVSDFGHSNAYTSGVMIGFGQILLDFLHRQYVTYKKRVLLLLLIIYIYIHTHIYIVLLQ